MNKDNKALLLRVYTYISSMGERHFKFIDIKYKNNFEDCFIYTTNTIEINEDIYESMISEIIERIKTDELVLIKTYKYSEGEYYIYIKYSKSEEYKIINIESEINHSHYKNVKLKLKFLNINNALDYLAGAIDNDEGYFGGWNINRLIERELKEK